MSRRAEIQAGETAPSSPLRRSNRRTALTNSPAPATLSSRRNSQTEATDAKTPKTRRASLSQENLEKNGITENKPAPRGRRVSTAKEDTEEKTEPAKTRSRRSSAAAEPPVEEAEKKQPVTRRRKSIVAEEQAELENVKPIKSRRGSVTDTPVEEDTVKRPVRSRRNSAKEEETKKEPPKKILRSRRGSATEETSEVQTKDKEPPVRGRRSSTDKLDDEPDTKVVKLTPIKSKRRPSVTENAVNLEPIKEQESEIKGRNSKSPLSSELKKAAVGLTDIKSDKDCKPILDLSTIDESSFTEESLNKSTSEKEVVTPRKSPRLNKKKVQECFKCDSLTPSKSSTMDKESVDEAYSPKQSEMISNKTKETVIEKSSPKQINKSNENLEEKAHQNKANLKNENMVENKSEEDTINETANESSDLDVEIKSEHTINETANESLEESLSSPRRKLDFERKTTEKISAKELVEVKEIDVKEEKNVQTENLIHDKSDSNTESIDQSILEAECEQESKEYNKQIVVETDKTGNPDGTLGSEDSFKFHLHVSNSENPDDNVENDLNTSKNSSSSDKENIEINSEKDPNISKINIGTQRKIKSLIENSDHDIHKEVQNIVGRVSNVFRPNMKENSFMEPMEVDESILDITQTKKSLDLEECDIKDTPPAVSTPIVKKSIKKIEKMSERDTVEINQSGHEQSIEVNKVDELIEESADKSEVITVDSELTLEDSEAIYISKQSTSSEQVDTKEGQTSDSLPEETTNVCNLERIEDTKMPRDVTFEVKKSDQLEQEHAERCESPLSDEEIEKKHSDKPAEESSFEIIEVEIEETRRVKSPPKSPQQITSEEMIEFVAKECSSKTLESEVQDEKNNTSMKSESHQIQDRCIDELKNETEKSSKNSKCPLIKTLIVELENKPILMKSGSRQPDHLSDELKPREPERSLRKSMSPPNDGEHLAIEQNSEVPSSRGSSPAERRETETDSNKKRSLSRKSRSPQPPVINTAELMSENNEMPLPNSERISYVSDSENLAVAADTKKKPSSRESRSPVERQGTEIDQNKKRSLSRKSKSPQPEVINTAELKSESNEMPLPNSKGMSSVNDKTAPGDKIENPDAELNRDKIFSGKSKSPQPEHQGVTEGKEISLASNKLNTSELNNSPEDSGSPRELNESESEPEAQTALRKDDFLQESGKMDISEDYEFEIPSDEEADKSHKLELEKTTIKSDNQLLVSENVSDKSPSSSPVKRKLADSEVEQSKKIRLAPTNVSGCEASSPDKLPVSDEIMSTEAKVEEPANQEDTRKDSDESVAEGLVEKDNLVGSKNEHKANINKSEDEKQLCSDTETEIIKENFADESNINKEIPCQKEVVEDEISIQNTVEDSSISVIDKDENVNAKNDLTCEKSSAQMDVTEMEASEETRTGDELVQIVNDTKERNKSQKISKMIKGSSIKSTHIDDNEEDSQNVQEVEDDKQLCSVTETEIVNENLADEPNINREIICQKEVIKEDEISIQNTVEDNSISVVDKDENVNANKDLTFEKSSAQMDGTEMEASEETGAGDQLVQIVTHVKERNKGQMVSKTIKESSVKSTHIDVNMVNVNSNDAEAISTGKEFNIMETDFQDVIQDSIEVKEVKRGKKKSKTIKKSSVESTQIDGNVEKSSFNDTKNTYISKESGIESDFQDVIQNSSDGKEGKKGKKKSKTIKKSSVESTQIDDNMEKSSSNDTKTMYISKESDIIEIDFQDVIQNSGDVKEEKKRKKKSKKQLNITKQNIHTIRKEEETPEDISVEESRSPSQKKSKKISTMGKNLKESNSYDIVEEMKTAEKSDKTKKTPVVDKNKIIESGKKKKSLFGANNEEECSSNMKKEKKHKKQKKSVEDVTYLENDGDNENRNKKRQKETKHIDSDEEDNPRKQALEGLDASVISKLDEYLSTEISEMGSEDESYSASGTEEEDNSEEENDLIYTMAEEGEEDTPSDGSNDIIDEGESINSTESEWGSDESYDLDDPFICDDEEAKLLSGEEYDLDDEKKKKKEKKSRIIQLEDCDDEIIKIKKKEKPIKKNKRSRIISVSDSSDSELDKNSDEKFLNKSVEEVDGADRTFEVEEEIDDDVIILEEKSTPVKFSDNQIASGLYSSNTDTTESSTKKRRKSIIIHENINVADIKNPDFSEKIANVVDTFCHRLYSGEVSMNLSLEHAVDNTAESSNYDDVFVKRGKRDKHFKKNSRDSDDSEESQEAEHSRKQQRMSISMDNIEDTGRQRSRKKRKSASLDDLSASKSKKSKIRRDGDRKKKNLEKTSHSKKIKSQKRNNGSKPPANSPEDLRTKTLSIMDELITDVKNRPIRTIKPSTTVVNMNGSWVSEVADIKPSTTLVKKVEEVEYKPGKIHPKDFRNKMLYDPSRVRRVETKTLLRKKGAYF